MSNLLCWHDGAIKPLNEVKVSPLDFGFIHSDATYDVMKSKNGKILFSDLHLDRFKESCKYFQFDYNDQILPIAQQLLVMNELSDAFIWTINWRGTPPSGSPRDVTTPQHSLIYVKPYYNISDNGLNLNIDKNHVRVPNLCYNQTYKNFGWIEFNLAQRNSIANGYDSVLLLNVNGYITEGPGFGVCFVRDGAVYTPLQDCLGSVTISVIESLCKENNIEFYRENIPADTISTFQECFVASTSGGITIVNRIEDTNFTHDTTLVLKEIYEQQLGI
jgi:branched-chain amino acid aminotransferase